MELKEEVKLSSESKSALKQYVNIRKDKSQKFKMDVDEEPGLWFLILLLHLLVYLQLK